MKKFLPWMLALALLGTGSACSDDDDDDDVSSNDDDDTTTANDDDTDPNDDDDDTTPERMVPRFSDGQLRVGMAEADITPEVTEIFHDQDDNAHWGDFRPFIDEDGDKKWDLGEKVSFEDANENGEYDRGERFLDADASGNPNVVEGQEPYEDTNGNGKFDAVWLSGYGSGRAASGVHDPVKAIAIVLSHNEEYVAIVALDLIGILPARTRAMAENLTDMGFDGRRLVVSATHSHQSPDTMGIWAWDILIPGFDPEYLGMLEELVPELVEEAVGKLTPADMVAGSVRMRDYDPWLTTTAHGGLNPSSPRMIGFINDIRDPLIVNDELSVMQFKDKESGEVIGTVTNWSGHPEVAGDMNNELSSDFNHYLRTKLEEIYGGIALAMPADVGGMQSTLGGDIPYFDEDGNQHLGGTDELEPVLIGEENFDFARSTGYMLAYAAQFVINGEAAPTPVNGLSVQYREELMPFDNLLLSAAVFGGILDVAADLLVDKSECGAEFTCLPTPFWMVRLGDQVQMGTAPGELFPEQFWGVPDDADFNDPRPNRWFVQHNPDDPMSQHAMPYSVANPVRPHFAGEKLNFVIGLAGAEFGYIVPEEDYILVGLDDRAGDHYEETNGTSAFIGTHWSRIMREMAADVEEDRVPLD